MAGYKATAKNRPAVALSRAVAPTTAALLANARAPRMGMSVKPELDRIRGTKLQERREQMRRADPLCAHCRRKGITRTWDELDHIVPLREGGADEPANCQGLCFECHAVKTADESRRANGYSVGNATSFADGWGGGT